MGDVEIGGWDKIHAFRNPPPHLLEKEIAKFPDWLVWNALISPKLELIHATAKNIGGDAYRIEVAVQNTGYLPSYVSKWALQRKQSRGLLAEIALPAGAKLVSGKLREAAGELECRAYKHTLMSFWTDTTPTADRTKLAWVVRASKGGSVDVVVKHEKAGTVRVKIKLA